jgi:hypothetical protein
MGRHRTTDEVCLAALRGWCNYPPDADLSKYQQAPETKEAWRRAIAAALAAMERREGESLAAHTAHRNAKPS